MLISKRHGYMYEQLQEPLRENFVLLSIGSLHDSLNPCITNWQTLYCCLVARMYKYRTYLGRIVQVGEV